MDACLLGVTVALNVYAGDKTVAFSRNLRGPYVNGTVVATHNASGSSCYNAVRLESLLLLLVLFVWLHLPTTAYSRTAGAHRAPRLEQRDDIFCMHIHSNVVEQQVAWFEPVVDVPLW